MYRNRGLVEIKNKEFLQKLKKDFDINHVKYKSMTPIICGTIVNKGFGDGTYDRKLKMLRAPLFALLQLCQS